MKVGHFVLVLDCNIYSAYRNIVLMKLPICVVLTQLYAA